MLKPIKIITAVPLSDEHADRIEEIFAAKHPDEDVDFVYEVNPSVLGGILIMDNGLLYDGTIKNDLEKLRRKLR